MPNDFYPSLVKVIPLLLFTELFLQLKMLWNQKVKVIPSTVEAIGRIPKNLEKKLGN